MAADGRQVVNRGIGEAQQYKKCAPAPAPLARPLLLKSSAAISGTCCWSQRVWRPNTGPDPRRPPRQLRACVQSVLVCQVSASHPCLRHTVKTFCISVMCKFTVDTKKT